VTILAGIMRRAATSAGIEKHVTAYTLRHTAATWLRQATGDSRLVAEYLGHADLSTVARYAHVASDELHAAAEALADDSQGHRQPAAAQALDGASSRRAPTDPEQLAIWD
jgi:integrase